MDTKRIRVNWALERMILLISITCNCSEIVFRGKQEKEYIFSFETCRTFKRDKYKHRKITKIKPNLCIASLKTVFSLLF